MPKIWRAMCWIFWAAVKISLISLFAVFAFGGDVQLAAVYLAIFLLSALPAAASFAIIAQSIQEGFANRSSSEGREYNGKRRH